MIEYERLRQLLSCVSTKLLCQAAAQLHDAKRINARVYQREVGIHGAADHVKHGLASDLSAVDAAWRRWCSRCWRGARLEQCCELS